MSDEIKEGALVKAWRDGYSEFSVGYFYKRSSGAVLILMDDGMEGWFDDCIEIPVDLAKQLEGLGK